MSGGNVAIGDDAIGDITGAAQLAVNGCLPGAAARRLRARLLAAFKRRGAENSKVIRLDTPDDMPVNVLAIWLMTRAEELVGEVKQSDMTVLVHPAAFDASGFELPLRKGDRIVRWPGQPREQVYTTLETPANYTTGDIDLLYRMIARG